MTKIRLAFPIAKEVRKVLFEIKKSDDYQEFLRQNHNLRLKYPEHITEKEALAFERTRAKIDDVIQQKLINRELVKEYLESHILRSCVSTKKNPNRAPDEPVPYRKHAVRRVKRYMRILQENTFKILSPYSFWLNRKIEKLVGEFCLNRII